MTESRLKPPLAAGSQIPFSRPPTPHASSDPPRLGFCGLGAMGRPMARNLATHQRSDALPVLVYNRTAAKAQALADELGPHKAAVASGPEQIARECDIVVTNLGDDAAVMSIYQRFAAALKNSHHDRPKIFVETSTTYPPLAGEIDNLISGPHTHFITSPVFGAPPAAAAAQLVVAMSGHLRSKKEVAFLFVPAVGRKVIDLGGNVEKAPMFKLIGNSLIIGSIELIGESMVLAEKSGVGAEHVDALINEVMPTPVWTGYSNKILHDQFDGTKGFAVEGGLKDASHMRALAAAHNAPMPVVDIAYQHLLTARALHAAQGEGATHKVLDWAAMVAGNRVAAGLDGLDSAKDSTKVTSQD